VTRGLVVLCSLAVLSAVPIAITTAKVIAVTTVPALQTAVNNSSAGDTIVLANGTYLDNTLTIGKSNIVVKALTPGGVFLNGTNDINITGNNITFSGFQFTSGDIGSSYLIEVSGSHNTITQLNVNGYSAKKYILLNAPSQYNTVSYCNFQNKPSGAVIGNLIHIDPDAAVPGYHRIRYCSFQNMNGAGGDNGNECIRISNGATSTYVSRTIIEYCYFYNTGAGDSEVISVKCQENVLRFNTNTNNQQGNFCFRNGNNNIAYGNFFINAGGIRVKEANNIYCYNNYFENCGDGSVTAPVKYVFVSPNLSNINFIHNTFINGSPIELDSGAVSNTWANNLFKKSSGAIFTGSATGITWAGNIRSGNPGISIPAGMISTNDVLLTNNSEGYQSLSSASPAIDASAAGFPALPDLVNIDDDPSLHYDISGQERPVSAAAKDVGCDEYAAGTTTNRPLTLSEVGPSYLGGPEPLPVTLTSLKAVIVGQRVSLEWFTDAETGNYGFDIERRRDDRSIPAGTGEHVLWERVGFVAGHGNRTSSAGYGFVDNTANTGRYAYRLKQIDTDGGCEYSTVIFIDVPSEPGFELCGNFPNPFNPETIIRFRVPESGIATLTVYNSSGQQIRTLFRATAETGNDIDIPFNAGQAASGIYFYTLRQNGRQMTKPMVLLR
jgi:hypothetical protein